MHEQLTTFVNSNANPFNEFKRTSNIKKALVNIAKKAEKKMSAHIFYSYNPQSQLMEPVTQNGDGVLPTYPSTFEDLLDSPEKKSKQMKYQRTHQILKQEATTNLEKMEKLAEKRRKKERLSYHEIIDLENRRHQARCSKSMLSFPKRSAAHGN